MRVGLLAEDGPGECRIADEDFDVRRAVKAFVDYDVLFVVEPDVGKREFADLPNGVGFAGCGHVVSWRGLLEHEVHGAHVIAACPQSLLASRFPRRSSPERPEWIRATALVILRVTNSKPRRGPS